MVDYLQRDINLDRLCCFKAALALLCLSGCGDDVVSDGQLSMEDSGGQVAPTVDCFTSSPHVEIGTGDVMFEALSSGDTVTMIHGPQGGWHMLGSVRTTGLQQIVRVGYLIVDQESGVVVSDNSYHVATVIDGECGGYFPGMYGYLSVVDLSTGALDTPPELLEGHQLLMTMNVSDSDGREASASVLVIAALDSADLDSGSADTGH